MVQARLIRSCVLTLAFAVVVGGATTVTPPRAPLPPDPLLDFAPGLVEPSEPEVVYERNGGTRDVSGRYRMLSAAVLLPETGHALRVIEFTRDSSGETPD